jgi:hypothetical protein
MLQKEEPFYIIIRDKKKELENRLLSTHRLYSLAKLEMGTDRTLVLFSNTAIQKTATIKDPSRKIREKKTLVATIP